MKKTIIALLALTGVAFADDSFTLKTGLEYTAADGTKVLYDGTTNPNIANTHYDKADWPGGSVTAENLILTITLNEMFGVPQGIASDAAITLSSVALRGEKNWCMDEGRRYVISSGQNSISGLLAGAKDDLSQGSDITFDLTSFTNLTMESVLTITLLPQEGAGSATFSVGCADVKTLAGNNGSFAWSGVTSNRNISPWGNECPLVTVKGSIINIPEPATATLSLLALAGLAARRRRK